MLKLVNLATRAGRREKARRQLCSALLKLRSAAVFNAHTIQPPAQLIDLIATAHPPFAFNIVTINKLIRKYSRGRSGRYTVTWRYVAQYRRHNTAAAWFLKDAHMDAAPIRTDRLINAATKLATQHPDSTPRKLRRFINTYVFSALKKSLLRDLRTVR